MRQTRSTSANRFVAVVLSAPILLGALFRPSSVAAQLQAAPRAYPYVACRATLDRIHLVSRSPVVYGLAIRTEPGVTAVRVFINTEKHSYAVTFTDLRAARPPGSLRYVTVGDPTPIESSWIDQAGSAAGMNGCSRAVPSLDDDGDTIAARETFATDALNRAYVDGMAVATAEDVTTVPPAERCFQPSMSARVVHATPPSIPASAASQRLHGTVQVVVDIDAQNEQTSVEVYRSSGYATLDAVGVQAGWLARFLTNSNACRPVAARYRYVVEFASR